MQGGNVKRFIKRSRSGAISSRIAAEQVSRLGDRIGLRRRLMGATHRVFSTEQSLEYIDSVYSDYVRYGGLEQRVSGSRVMEIGPGDNLGVAARFIASGASEVVALDRFSTWRDPQQQRDIYEGMRAQLSPVERGRLVGSVTEDGAIDPGRGRIKLKEGIKIEDAPDALVGGRFDLIVSRAVLEHVVDLESAFSAMDKLLAKDGLLVHKVDLTDHLMFSGSGQHPLTFLGVSDRTWGLMGASDGIHNRCLIGYYRDLISSMGYEATFWVSGLLGVDGDLDPALVEPGEAMMREPIELAEKARSSLLPRYRDLPAAELATTDFFLVAHRAGEGSDA